MCVPKFSKSQMIDEHILHVASRFTFRWISIFSQILLFAFLCRCPFLCEQSECGMRGVTIALCLVRPNPPFQIFLLFPCVKQFTQPSTALCGSHIRRALPPRGSTALGAAHDAGGGRLLSWQWFSDAKEVNPNPPLKQTEEEGWFG